MRRAICRPYLEGTSFPTEEQHEGSSFESKSKSKSESNEPILSQLNSSSTSLSNSKSSSLPNPSRNGCSKSRSAVNRYTAFLSKQHLRKCRASFDTFLGIFGISDFVRIFSRISSLSLPSHGTFPVSNLSTTHPSAQISDTASCSLPITASGDRYIGVPRQRILSSPNFLFLHLDHFALLASPKSPIFALNSV
ncbi:AN1-type zinc finger protein 5 [Striga asiatica]|uniref:AN1-type zinc finger protein 5 n=1 Tax=Striga asiatica TaxID=4170 RepID=A0A5A7QVR8_STRAF|nr:AN1-type zinc finger protein 5 [Striga asiatica]